MKKENIYKAIAIIISIAISLLIAKYIYYIFMGTLLFCTLLVFYKICSDLYRSEVLGEDIDLECGYEEVNE